MHFNRLLLLGLLFSLFVTAGCAARQTATLPSPIKNTPPMAEVSLETPEFDMIKPVDGPVRSEYGMRRHPTQKVKKFHTGIDIAAARGSDVLAAANGNVTFTGKRNGYGNTVEIDHGNGKSTLYAHLDKILVRQGQTLEQGERIGLVGRTGRTTGPNLHFELIAEGKHTNPIPEQGWKEPGSGSTFARATILVPEAQPSFAASVKTAIPSTHNPAQEPGLVAGAERARPRTSLATPERIAPGNTAGTSQAVSSSQAQAAPPLYPSDGTVQAERRSSKRASSLPTLL